MTDSRPQAYYDGELVVFRGSAVGSAAHGLAASLAGVAPAPFSAQARMRMDEGHLHESDILSRVAAEAGMEWSVRRDRMTHDPDDQEEIDYPITGRIVVRLHPDGFLFEDGEPRYVMEAKAQGRDVWEGWKGFDSEPRYATQFALEMFSTGLPGVFARKNRDTGELDWKAYVDAPVGDVEIRRRLIKITAESERGNLNPFDEVCKEWGCGWFFLHNHDPGEVVADEEIDSLAAMVAQARERREQAEEMEKMAREKLREYLGETGKRRTADWSVSYQMRDGRVSYDTKAMAADGIEVERYARQGKAYPVVTVKRLGANKRTEEGAG